MAGGLEAAFARTASEAAGGDLPEEVVAALKGFVLDSLAVGVAGTSRPDAETVLAAARGWGSGSDGASLLGGEALPAAGAACVDAFLIHGLEFDCVHEGAVVHAMAAPLAASLALAGRGSRAGHPVTGKRLIRALSIGVDLAVALGLAARGPMRFFRPATASAFGATAAAASLLGLDDLATGSALGLALGQTAGTLQAHVEGSVLLPLQMGFAARTAVQSVDLAIAGLAGPAAWLTGRYGYLQLFEDGAVDLGPLEALAGGEAPHRTLELSYKPFPSGRLTHGAIDGLGRLQAEQGFLWPEIDSIRVVVPPLVEQLVGRPVRAEMDAAYARLCLAYCAACRLVRGRVDVPAFHPAALGDPTILGLAGKITIEVDPRHPPTAIVPQTVEVRLKDGRSFGCTREAILGSPDAPLDGAARLAKVRHGFEQARPARARTEADRLIERVARLEDCPDVARLLVPQEL